MGHVMQRVPPKIIYLTCSGKNISQTQLIASAFVVYLNPIVNNDVMGSISYQSNYAVARDVHERDLEIITECTNAKWQ